MAPYLCWTMSFNVQKEMSFRASSLANSLDRNFRRNLERVVRNSIQTPADVAHSYQEMITHLAMNSHPDPKSVLVIGGGDGGVLREVVKHDTVETAILCDIDEAVIRVSKKYLPGMSIGFQHPSVQTHIGDGFKFLADRKNEFDIIITDSSDPEGPAETLFQKPYFELLYGALKEGGVITTQGCAHCPFSPCRRLRWHAESMTMTCPVPSKETNKFFLQPRINGYTYL